jgi:hypothetical protein
MRGKENGSSASYKPKGVVQSSQWTGYQTAPQRYYYNFIIEDLWGRFDDESIKHAFQEKA